MKSFKELFEQNLTEAKYKKGQTVIQTKTGKKGEISNFTGDMSMLTILWNDKKESEISSEKLKKSSDEKYNWEM